MEHKAGFVNSIDLILRGDSRLKIELYETKWNKCPVDIRFNKFNLKNKSHA